MPNKRLTSPGRVVAAERKAQALNLRKAGATCEQIAKTLGISTAGAHKLISRALREMVQEPAQELITLEAARLDALLMAVWADATRGNMTAIDRALKIMERRARMFGLDAPAKVHVTGWRDQALADIRAGRLTYEQVAAAFNDDNLAAQLFREAGVKIDDNPMDEDNITRLSG